MCVVSDRIRSLRTEWEYCQWSIDWWERAPVPIVIRSRSLSACNRRFDSLLASNPSHTVHIVRVLLVRWQSMCHYRVYTPNSKHRLEIVEVLLRGTAPSSVKSESFSAFARCWRYFLARRSSLRRDSVLPADCDRSSIGRPTRTRRETSASPLPTPTSAFDGNYKYGIDRGQSVQHWIEFAANQALEDREREISAINLLRFALDHGYRLVSSSSFFCLGENQECKRVVSFSRS